MGNFSRDDELGLAFKVVIFIGKFLGVLPIFDTTENMSKAKYWLKQIISSIVPIITIFMCFVNFILIIYDILKNYRPQNLVSFAEFLQEPMFHFTVSFFHIYMMTKRNAVKFLMTKWKSETRRLTFKERDRHLYLHVNLITIVIIVGAVSENLLFDSSLIVSYYKTNVSRQLKVNTSTMSKPIAPTNVLQVTYKMNAGILDELIPYNAVMATFILIANKFINYTWNYMDVLVMVFCRALSYKFRALNNQIEIQLSKYLSKKSTKLHETMHPSGIFPWNKVRSDFLIVCSLKDLINDFLSPIIFVSYCTTMHSICLQLHVWIKGSALMPPSEVHAVYISLSFFQFTIRVCMLTYFASNVNVSAHKIAHCLQKCPRDEYNEDVERLERMLLLQPVRIHALEMFFITREFVLHLINFMFTTQVIMLQTNAL